ncbi:MAG: hypothetical protein ABJP45_11035 [Cyclobacteriaceae bacterium]
MKKLSNLLAALVFVSLVIFIGCSSDSGGGGTVDPLQTQADLLNGSWTASANQVFYAGSPSTDGDWSTFSLTISGATTTGGSYTVSGVPAGFEDVWNPAGGSWTWGNTAGTVVDRGDVDISVVVSASSLELNFDNTGTLGRTSGIEGAWKFVFAK